MNAERRKLTAFIKRAFIAVVCFTALPLLFFGCSIGNEGNPTVQPGVSQEKPEKLEEPIELSIMCVGDVMIHRTQIESQFDNNAGKYDYTNNYKYVKDYISQADLALCNVETTFAGKPYSGYPAFSAPDELAEALKDSGFDVAITANNHMMDKGGAGLQRTLEVLRKNGFDIVGSRQKPEEKRYSMTEAKDLKIAVVAYTYETPSSGQGTALNGVPVSKENAELINSFSTETLDEDLEGIKAVCDEARQDGADIVILYYHWGEEYQSNANTWQRSIAQKSIDEMDIDMIFGSHPHVLQEMEYMQRQEDGKKVPVFFSMGNFISNQRTETLDSRNRHTESGIIAEVNLKYLKSEGKITDITMSALPTWVEKYSPAGKAVYEIIPLDEKLQENETLKASGHLWRAEQALEDANGILKAN